MTSTTPERRIVVALSGASGAVYGVRLLQALRDIPSVQTHLTVSDAAWLNVRHELDLGPGDLEPLAHVTYPVADVGDGVSHMRQRLQIPGAQVEFVSHVQPGGVGHGEVGLHGRDVAQRLEQAHAVHGATGAAQGYNDAALRCRGSHGPYCARKKRGPGPASDSAFCNLLIHCPV